MLGTDILRKYVNGKDRLLENIPFAVTENDVFRQLYCYFESVLGVGQSFD